MKIKLKHEKQKYEVDVEPSGGLELMKAQIQSVTGVPADRQKIVLKGKEIKEGDDLEKLLKEGVVAMLMGSADAIPEKPKEVTRFIEDEVGGSTIEINPCGMENLGNTCYLNSTIQALRNVPELVDQLKTVNAAGAMQPTPSAVAACLRSLYAEMEKHKDGSPVAPYQFVTLCRMMWPQFDQHDGKGHYMQQDAEEYCTALLTSLQDALRIGTDLFDGKYEEVTKCAETDEEPPSTNHVPFRMLRCNVDAESATMEAGIERALVGQREMQSPTLGRNAIYNLNNRIDKLPEYLWVQFVRFDWKKVQQQRAKKLRKVVFPLTLDVYTLCSERLKKELDPVREQLKKERDRRIEAKRAGMQERLGKGDADKEKEDGKKEGEEKKEKEGEEKKEKEGEEKKEEKKSEEPAAAAGPSNTAEEPAKADAMDVDKPVEKKWGNDSGYYELCAVITHKGRDCDSGHYVGWTKQKDGRWMCFDDTRVYEVNEDKIKGLAGGGEADSAYLVLYRSRDQDGNPAGL